MTFMLKLNDMDFYATSLAKTVVNHIKIYKNNFHPKRTLCKLPEKQSGVAW